MLLTLKKNKVIYYLAVLISVLSYSMQTKAQITANFTSNVTSGCAPLVVQFTDLSTGNPTAWAWNFGNGNVSSLRNPTVVYINPGTYTVTLTASAGAIGNTVTRVAYITVFANPTANFTATPVSGCTPLTVNFADASTQGSAPINSWAWDFGNGNSSNSQNPSFTYTQSGTYPVTLIVRDANNCQGTASRPNYITVSRPTAAFTANPRTACSAPLTVNFTNTSQGTGNTYLWRFGNGSTSTAVNPTHTYTTSGNYNVTLVVTDANGCKDSLVMNNYITIQPMVTNFSVSDQSICVGELAQFTDNTNSTPNNWNWNFGDGTTSSTQNPSHAYTNPGTYTITLLASNASGCSDIEVKTLYMTVNPLPVANFVADSVTACQIPFNVTFTNTSVNGASWQWYFGDGATSSLQSPSHVYNQPGLYDVKLIVTSPGGCVDSLENTDYIRIIEPRAGFRANVLEGCVPLDVNFTDTSFSNEPVVSWIWDFGDGTTSNLQNPTHTYTTDNVFTVRLIIVNASGCTDTITRIAYVRAGNFPFADFSSVPTVGCINTIFQFTDLSATANEWHWDFGDGSVSTAQNPAFQYADTGFYDVTLVAVKNGCADTIVKQDYIQVLAPIARFSITQSCVTPYDVAFTDNSVLPHTWLWNFGDGNSAATQNPSHTYAARGTYNVTLTVSDTVSGCADSLTSSLTITDPVAGFSANPVVGCYPLAVTFTNTSTDAVSYQWNFGNGVSSANLNPSNNYTSPGLYSSRLIVTDMHGCRDTLYIADHINALGPVPELSGDVLTGCTPLIVNFSDLTVSDSTLTSWSWNFGDGNSSADQNPTHTYTVRGDYAVTLVVTDTNGCSATRTRNNYIHATYPYPDFTVNRTEACLNQNITFTNTSSAPNATYEWDFGDGDTSTATSPVHAYSAPGAYTITLRAIDPNGCDSIIVRNAYISVQEPLAGLTSNDTSASCPPLPADFFDASSGTGNIVGWDWDFGDNSFSTLQNPSHIYTTAGTFDVTLIVTTNIGCKDTMVMADFIRVLGPSGAFTFTPDTACKPSTVTFTATTSNSMSHNWDFDDGNIGTGQNVTNTYMTGGEFSPVLVLEDTAGCVVLVNAPAPVVVINVPIVITSDTAICNGSSITLNASGGTSYLWSPSVGLSCTNCANPVANPVVPTTYKVVVSDGTCIDSSTVAVAVNPLPVVTLGNLQTLCANMNPVSLSGGSPAGGVYSGTAVSNGAFNPSQTGIGTYPVTYTYTDPNGCANSATANLAVLAGINADFTVSPTSAYGGQVITFTDASTGAANWVWVFGDGDSATTQNTSHIYQAGGNYNPVLIIYSSDGCWDSTSLPITITEGIVVPNVFSPNGDGVNDAFNVVVSGVTEYTIDVFNRWGTKVFSTTAPAITWDGRTTAGEEAGEGTYYYVIKAKSTSGKDYSTKGYVTLFR